MIRKITSKLGRNGRRTALGTGTAIAATVALVAVSAPAFASVGPYSGPCVTTWTSCSTGYLHAGANGITVEYATKLGGGTFKLIDLHNGVNVWGKGLGNFQDYWKSVPGLSSDYYCVVSNAGPGAGCAIFQW